MAKFDSYRDHNPTAATFLVEVDGQQLGQFQQASGLSVTVEVEEVVEGGQNFHTHKLPGRFTFDNVRLTRGVTEDNGFLAWIDTATAGAFEKNGNKMKRTTVAITLVSASGTRLRTWTLQEAFPVSWSGPDFALSDDSFPTEELELAHHGFTVTDHKAKAPAKKAKKPAAKKPAAKKRKPYKKVRIKPKSAAEKLLDQAKSRARLMAKQAARKQQGLAKTAARQAAKKAME
jgi:phage tail-like protein